MHATPCRGMPSHMVPIHTWTGVYPCVSIQCGYWCMDVSCVCMYRRVRRVRCVYVSSCSSCVCIFVFVVCKYRRMRRDV